MNKRQHRLITSGKTLTAKETEEVERLLWSSQTSMTPYQLNSAIGRAAVGLPPSFQNT
jgi:hypothetical protein